MARDQFSKMAAQLEAGGVAKGYRQAIKDARREYNAAMDRLLAALENPTQENAATMPLVRHRSTAAGTRENSTQGAVFKLIQDNPGLRGVDVARALQGRDSTVQERTVRTALSRLKRMGRIMQTPDGKWVAPVPTIRAVGS